MKLLILLLFTGCAHNFADKKADCIEKYLNNGVNAEWSIKICKEILGRTK